MHFSRKLVFPALLLTLLGVCTQSLAATFQSERYKFSYEFASGGRLEGTFDGRPYTGNTPVFQGTLIFLPSPALATYTDPSGFSFTWDTSLPTHTTSQVSLITTGEFAFVTFDGSKMDIAFAAGNKLLFLENGVQDQGTRNNASTTNLLTTDLSEPFIPANWSLMKIPEPSTYGLLSFSTILITRRQRTK